MDDNNLNIADDVGRTGLYIACRWSWDKLIEYLLENVYQKMSIYQNLNQNLLKL